MASEIAQSICDAQSRMESERGVWESHWSEIAERVLPRADHFLRVRGLGGDKRTDRVYDSAPQIALERFAAVLDSLLTPRQSRWHRLGSSDKSMDKSPRVRAWFEAATEALFRYRYNPEANFASQAHENYLSLGAFGTGCIYTEDNLHGGGVRYSATGLKSIYFETSAWGVIDTVHRKFALTTRQAGQMFKDRLPRSIASAEPHHKHWFVHCVKPNDQYDRKRRDAGGRKFASYYVATGEKVIVAEGGYNTMPFAISRYVVAPDEQYGRSPAMMALPDIKTLMEAKKTWLRQRQLQLDPPLLVVRDGVLSVKMTPGGINRGGLDERGNPLVRPMETGSRFDAGQEVHAELRNSINDVFLVNLFQVLLENPNMTATQVLEIAQQRGILLAPMVGRQQSEFLGPLIEREIDILASQGRLPEMPQELIEAEGEYQIVYESPLNIAARAEDALRSQRFLESLAGPAQFDPSVMDNIDLDEYARAQHYAWGAKAELLRSAEDVKDMRERRQADQAAAQVAEVAPKAAGAIKDLAAARQAVAA